MAEGNLIFRSGFALLWSRTNLVAINPQFQAWRATPLCFAKLDVRLPDDYAQILDDYCAKTGANKTGTIKMLLKCIKDEDLLAIIRKRITVD